MHSEKMSGRQTNLRYRLWNRQWTVETTTHVFIQLLELRNQFNSTEVRIDVLEYHDCMSLNMDCHALIVATLTIFISQSYTHRLTTCFRCSIHLYHRAHDVMQLSSFMLAVTIFRNHSRITWCTTALRSESTNRIACVPCTQAFTGDWLSLSPYSKLSFPGHNIQTLQ